MSLSQTEQLELREATQFGPGTKISRIRSSKPAIKPTRNMRLREMRGQGARSPWRSRRGEGPGGSNWTLLSNDTSMS